MRPALPWLAVFSWCSPWRGCVWGYQFAPADWEQGDAARIMYVHVPAAWVAMAGYAALAGCSFASIVWRHPLADIAAEEIGPVGAGFTFVCLVSGALWGKPMWGAYWVWDARLTSVLILFFLYLGHIALMRAFENKAHGYRAGAILALAGAVNLPVIVYSVQWWNTLHQGNSISFTGGSKIDVVHALPTADRHAGVLCQLRHAGAARGSQRRSRAQDGFSAAGSAERGMINPWPFINGAYGVTMMFLSPAGWLSFARARRAAPG